MEQFIEKLKALIAEGKADEAQALFTEMQKFVASLDDKIKAEERAKKEAVETRDVAKSKLSTYDRAVGRAEDETIGDAVARFSKNQGAKESEKLAQKDKEIEALKTEISTAQSKTQSDLHAKDQALLGMILERDVASLASKYKIKENAVSYVITNVKNLASFENGKIVFKDKDGITSRVDGRDKNVDDIVKDMREKEVQAKESMFFDTKVQQSGGSGFGAGEPLDSKDYHC